MMKTKVKKESNMLKVLLTMIASLFCFAFLALMVIADIPSASVVIWGPNGTSITGTRNVFLNMSYSSSDGIDSCRWANDAALNLASAPWEKCTTNKAWILSDGYGTKVVFFEVRDGAGHTNFASDPIAYQYLQDYTAPTPPIVYDGISGPDIDWWNSNTSISAHWFNSTEDISTISYKYRLLNDSDYYVGTSAWTDVGTDTDVTVTGLLLQEGWNMTFEVMAYNPFSFNSTSSSDNVTIDLTKPNAPSITSSTHPTQTQAYDSSTAIFNFTATDPISNGVSSGVEGYSYLIDKHPGTAPDSQMEERSWETLRELHKGSYNQTLKVNGSTASDVAYAVFSQIDRNISNGDRLKVKVVLAERFEDYSDLMDVKAYMTTVPNGQAISSFSYEALALTDVEWKNQDIRYVESLTDAHIYEFDLTSIGNFDDTAADCYLVIAGYAGDDDNRRPLDIIGTTNPSFLDSSTRGFVCDENNNCQETSATVEYAVGLEKQDTGTDHTVRYDYLGDGSYYFHVKAKDFAGNWGDSSHYRIIVAAGGVSSMIYSPVDGQVFSSPGDLNITVKVSVADNTSAKVAVLHPLGGWYNSSEYIFNRSFDFENITLELGQNEIFAVTNTSSGAIAHSPSVFVTVSATAQPYTNKTLRIKYGGGGNIGTHLTWQTVGSSFVGTASESTGSIIGAGEVQTDTEYNTMKIFMTKPFDTSRIDNELAENDFLDRVNPAFGYRSSASWYVIRNTLEYNDIFLGGNFIVPAGTYQLYIRKAGTTLTGVNNITLTIG